MQVGIMARSHGGLLATFMQLGCPSGDGENATYAAQSDDMFITVGKITHVATEHIEYRVNTVPGFSGGAVVLLAPGTDEHMQVLVAHAGCSEAKGVNFGFLVAKKVKEHGAPRNPLVGWCTCL
uniref:Uncharacterized protein n=1 Tax=Entomoneis paludosa TaxID=265537 RepID=A0A7S3DSH3_9STRA|mmetsp:Transcript_31875/g.66517  ORF Transcript_31875/g.66517 Transcript_31875/m.66517 type:complete len:123 (+) Transcript_31875:479-847(+)